MSRAGWIVIGLLVVPGSAEAAQSDTATYATPATRELVNRARVRHIARTAAVRDYSARLQTRIEGRFGGERWGRNLPIFAYEAAGRLAWHLPNVLDVELQGARIKSIPIPGWRDRGWLGFWTEVFAEQPWFIPRFLGDSIQMLGVPEIPALHPLAVAGELYYRYALGDSIAIETTDMLVRAVEIVVSPKHLIESMAVGSIWVDARSGEVVRMDISFVGTAPLDYEDEDDDPVMTSFDTSLEYFLYQGRVWMPRRQIMQAAWSWGSYGISQLGATGVTTFSDYRINEGAPLAFDTTARHADVTSLAECSGDMMFGSERRLAACGARPIEVIDAEGDLVYRVAAPPLDSLTTFEFAEPLSLYDSPVDQREVDAALRDLGRIAGQYRTQRRVDDFRSVDIEHSLDAFRFNRVQGLSVGASSTYPLGNGYDALELGGRIGAGDLRPTGYVAWNREAPGGTVELIAYRRLADLEPWTRGGSLGNSASALLLGWDDAHYMLALGGGISVAPHAGLLRDFTLTLSWEDQESVTTSAGSIVNDVFLADGDFPANPPIAEGQFLLGSIVRRHYIGPSQLEIGIAAMGDDSRKGGRGWAQASLLFLPGSSRLSVTPRTGAVVGDDLPQLDYRLGGPFTVRGYEYGVATVDNFWSVQLDLLLPGNEWVAPLLLLDAGGTYDGEVDPLVGAGGGVSLARDWIRIFMSIGIDPHSEPRLDIALRIPR